PDRWRNRVRELGSRLTASRAFFALFKPEYRRRTLLNAAYLLISMIGLWAGSVYVPSSVTLLAGQAGMSAAQAARLASYATMLLSIGTILGCLMMPWLADSVGRRGALGVYFALMFV